LEEGEGQGTGRTYCSAWGAKGEEEEEKRIWKAEMKSWEPGKKVEVGGHATMLKDCRRKDLKKPKKHGEIKEGGEVIRPIVKTFARSRVERSLGCGNRTRLQL